MGDSSLEEVRFQSCRLNMLLKRSLENRLLRRRCVIWRHINHEMCLIKMIWMKSLYALMKSLYSF